MLEVFLAYNKEIADIKELEATLEAWSQPGLEPVVIEAKGKKFELHRRVVAENISVGNYVLASLGSAPLEKDFGSLATKVLADNPTVGLIHVSLAGEMPSGRVMVCRRGVITHWVTPTGDYIKAHEESYRHAGHGVMTLCPSIHYRLLTESLPS